MFVPVRRIASDIELMPCKSVGNEPARQSARSDQSAQRRQKLPMSNQVHKPHTSCATVFSMPGSMDLRSRRWGSSRMAQIINKLATKPREASVSRCQTTSRETTWLELCPATAESTRDANPNGAASFESVTRLACAMQAFHRTSNVFI